MNQKAQDDPKASSSPKSRETAASAGKRTAKPGELKLQPLSQSAADSQAPPPTAPPSQFVVPPIHLPQQSSQSPMPATAAPSPQNPPPATAPATPLSVVDDSDLIEKEWVSKAKQIVTQTQDDPYKQSEELTMFKAEYMKKRYDKHIKLSN